MASNACSSATRIQREICLIIFLMAGLATTALGQVAARPDRGIREVGTYSVSDIESVNLTTGNLNLNIPLASLPPVAGGKLGLTLSASYNSKLWDITRREVQSNVLGGASCVTDAPQLGDNGGWSIRGSYSLQFRNSRDDFAWLQPDFNDPDYLLWNQFQKVTLTTPDGARHELRPLDYAPYQRTRDFLWGYYTQTPDNPSQLRDR